MHKNAPKTTEIQFPTYYFLTTSLVKMMTTTIRD